MIKRGRQGAVAAAVVTSLLLAVPARAFTPAVPADSGAGFLPSSVSAAVEELLPAATETRPRQPLTSEEIVVEAVADGAMWCLRGATFAVLFSAAFSLPGMVTGMGTAYGSARAASAAMAGCGMAMTWRAVARTLAYLDGVLHPMTALPEPPARPVAKHRPLIETAG